MTVGSPKTMQAWVVSQPGPIETSPLRYVEKPVPDPGPGELVRAGNLVRVMRPARIRGRHRRSDRVAGL
jgi:hypothetical protein